MKSLTKKKLNERMGKSLYKPEVKLYRSFNLPDAMIKYQNSLKIVIPGKPIQDSRPRFTNKSEGVHAYNPHKANLMKIFDEVYKDSILENICIVGAMRVDLTLYVPMVKKYVKGMNKQSKKTLEKELMPCLSKPDLDNYEKVHYDVLQDDKYMVILMDENIVENRTRKFYVKDEKYARAEIVIHYNDTIDLWYWNNAIKNSKEYFKYTISPKYMKMHKVPDKDWGKTFFGNIYSFYKETNSKTIIDTVRSILRIYTTEEIYKISEGKNVDEATNNILKIVERMTQV